MKTIHQQIGMIICLTIFIFAPMAFSAASDDLSRTLNGMHSMTANFTQTTYDNRGKAIQTSYGQLAFIRPGKFRWEIKKPIPQLIIANNQQVWIVDPDLMQVTIRKAKREFGETPTMLLSENVVQLEKRFNVTRTDKDNKIVYQLKPKVSDSMFVNIQLTFKNNQINGMHLQDQLGHGITVQFNRVVVNPSLSYSLFQYKPIRGMDVIKE